MPKPDFNLSIASKPLICIVSKASGIPLINLYAAFPPLAIPIKPVANGLNVFIVAIVTKYPAINLIAVLFLARL